MSKETDCRRRDPAVKPNATGRVKLKGGALLSPVPPALVTVKDVDKINVLTVAWTGILATTPPTTYISVRPRRYSYQLLQNSREFVIHLPPASLAREVDYCGTFTGAKVDKFEKCRFTLLPSDKVAAPTLAECPLALECRVKEILPMGSHDVFISEIVSVSADERLFDSNGKLRLERADLLAFGHGEYYSLGQKVGVFGFSAIKRSKKNAGSGKKKGDVHGKRR